jgi:hypothetical protein
MRKKFLHELADFGKGRILRLSKTFRRVVPQHFPHDLGTEGFPREDLAR